MTDYEFGQAVMAAAGVCPRLSFEGGKMYADAERFESYPDPLKPEGHDALWDVLVEKRLSVHLNSTIHGEYCCIIATPSTTKEQASEGYFNRDATVQVFHADRKAALVEAAAKALGVSRE